MRAHYFRTALFLALALSVSLGLRAGEFPDAPLEPGWTPSEGELENKGSILEFWLLSVYEEVKRMPSDPSATGMIDDSQQVFSASAMTKDPEMAIYANQPGLLQWTSFYNVKKAGKHVFTLAVTGAEEWYTSRFARSGVWLAINDEIRLGLPYGKSGSATVDFAKPGFYKFQVRLWYSEGERLNWQDARVSVKVREPGALSQRQMTADDLLYRFPE